MTWSANNRAHACLWVFETWDLGQRGTSFAEAGAWSTDILIRGAGGSADTVQSKARAHAMKLDDVFRSLFGASFEPNVTSEIAITAMTQVLSDATKTLSDLGEPVDKHYRFLGEVA